MAVEFAVTLDDGELWIPSDIFPAEDREVQQPNNHHHENHQVVHHRENHRQLPNACGAPAFGYQNPSPRPPIPERMGRFGPGPIMAHFVPMSPALRGPPLGFPRPPVHPQAIPIRPAQRLIETRVPCNYNNRPPIPVHALPLQSQIGLNRAQNPSGPNRVPRNRPPRCRPQNRLLPFQATAGAVYMLGGCSTNNNCRGAYLGTGVFIPMPTSAGNNLFFRTRRGQRDNRRGQRDAGREEGDAGGEQREAAPEQGDAGGEQRDIGRERRELGNNSGPISQTNNQEEGSNNQEEGSNNAESSIISTNGGQNTNQATNPKAGNKRVVPADETPIIKEKGESSSSCHRKPSRKVGCIEKATEEYYSLPKEWTY